MADRSEPEDRHDPDIAPDHRSGPAVGHASAVHRAHDAHLRTRAGRLLAALVVLASLAVPLGTAAAPRTAGAETGQRAAEVVYDGTDDRIDGTIYRLYRAFFLREPDGDGIVYWISEARYRRYPIGSIAEEFARSPEFRQRYGTLDDAAFVDLVYRNVLGRAAEPEGRSYWLGQLRGGMLRGHLMLYFSDSVEFGRAVGAGPFGTRDFRGPAEAAPTAPRGSYLFLPDGSPDVLPPRWAACRPVYVVANPAGIPASQHDEFVAMLEHALDAISTATDQHWVHVGPTAYRSADSSSSRKVFGQVTISFMTAPDPNEQASAWALPLTGPHPLTGRVQYVSGVVNLNAQRLVGDVGGRVTPLVATTLMHELGHIAGLDHVEDPSQLMHGYYSLPSEPRYETYRDGDRAGLARVGSATVAC